MIKYDPKSLKAEEFINEAEINETLKYADEHKDDIELIDKIIEKAKERKGLNHREASVLLACENEEKNKEIYDLAEQIKKRFLRQQNSYVCSPLSFKLLRKRLSLLPLSSEKQAYSKEKAYSGGSCKRGYCSSGYGS